MWFNIAFDILKYDEIWFWRWFMFEGDLWALKCLLWNLELRYDLWLLRRVRNFLVCFMNYEVEMLLNNA
jgi:hypothetical protein